MAGLLRSDASVRMWAMSPWRSILSSPSSGVSTIAETSARIASKASARVSVSSSASCSAATLRR